LSFNALLHHGVFTLAPQTPGTGVFSLESTFGLSSLPHSSQLEPLELGAIQSSFAVSGSKAKAENLHHWGKAGAQIAYGSNGPIFIHSSLGDSRCNTDATGLYEAGGSLMHINAGVCDRVDCSYGCIAPDTPHSDFSGVIGDRYHIFVCSGHM
jgi:hypothetical protein